VADHFVDLIQTPKSDIANISAIVRDDAVALSGILRACRPPIGERANSVLQSGRRLAALAEAAHPTS